MPKLWDMLDQESRAICRRICGKRWKDPDQRDMDDIPIDISREMSRKPKGDAALIGGQH